MFMCLFKMEVIESLAEDADNMDHQSEHEDQDHHSEHSEHEPNPVEHEDGRNSHYVFSLQRES